MALPNMSLEQSTVNVTTDPTWSLRHEQNWIIIDGHDHITVGKKIVPEALDINEDLSLQGNNLIDLRSPIFQNLNYDPSLPTDLCSLYFKNGNLWLNNGSGGHVQVSNGSGLNVSTGVSNLYIPVHIATSTTILNTDDYTYIEVETNTSINLFLPNASTVAGNRFYYIKDVTGLSGTNAITLVPTGGNLIDGFATNYVMKRNWGSWLLVSDGVSKWYVSNFSNKEINDGTWNSVGYTMAIDAKANSFVIKNNVSSNAVVLNNSFGSTRFDVNVDAFFTGSSTIIGSTIGSVDQLDVYSNADFKNNVILGSSAADTLTVNSVSNFLADSTFNTVNVNFQVNNVSFAGNVDIGNAPADILTVTATSNFLNNVTIGTAFSDLLIVESTATYNSPVSFTDNVGFDEDVTLGSTSTDVITVNASSVFNSVSNNFAGINILGTSTLTGRLGASSAGRLTKRLVSLGTATVGPNTADIIYSSGMSPTWTISDTSAINGDNLMFSFRHSGLATINDPGGVAITTLTAYQVAIVGRVSGSWILIAKFDGSL